MKIIKMIFICFGALFLFIPFAYWMAHPELTEMQVYIKFWWAYWATVALILCGFFIEEKHKSG